MLEVIYVNFNILQLSSDLFINLNQSNEIEEKS